VVSEANRTLCVGSEISASISEELFYDLDAPVVRIGAPDVPAMPFAAPLEEFFMPSAEEIYASMRDLARS
jgi:2-oxoisovalerate dehydrogenase E1 component beta subunit